MKKIKYYVKCTFGIDKIYPAEFVDEFKIITRRKTLEHSDFKAFQALGIEFEQVLPPPSRSQ
jgi:hypothetical protein